MPYIVIRLSHLPLVMSFLTTWSLILVNAIFDRPFRTCILKVSIKICVTYMQV